MSDERDGFGDVVSRTRGRAAIVTDPEEEAPGQAVTPEERLREIEARERMREAADLVDLNPYFARGLSLGATVFDPTTGATHFVERGRVVVLGCLIYLARPDYELLKGIVALRDAGCTITLGEAPGMMAVAAALDVVQRARRAIGMTGQA